MHDHAFCLKCQYIYWHLIMKSPFIIFHIVLLRLKSSPHLLIINIIFEQIVQWEGFYCLLWIICCRSSCRASLCQSEPLFHQMRSISPKPMFTNYPYYLSDQRVCVVPNHAWTFEPQFTPRNFNNDPLISEWSSLTFNCRIMKCSLCCAAAIKSVRLPHMEFFPMLGCFGWNLGSNATTKNLNHRQWWIHIEQPKLAYCKGIIYC